MTKNYKIYYHYTEPQSVGRIFREGLKPKIGERSKNLGEPEPEVYLCRHEDLESWQLFLPMKEKYLICLRIPKNFAEKHIHRGLKYGKFAPYQEYLCEIPIPAEYIQKTVPLPKPSKETVCSIGKDLFYDLSFWVVHMIQFCDSYENETDETEKDYLNRWGTMLLDMLEKPEIASVWDKIPKETLQKIVTDFGNDGEYTLCDMYKNTSTALWEKLDQFENCPLYTLRKTLKEKICLHFPWLET